LFRLLRAARTGARESGDEREREARASPRRDRLSCPLGPIRRVEARRKKSMATSSNGIFTEKLHKGYAQSMELKGAKLREEKSRYQQIKIFDTVANGRVLVLDDIVQMTTRDESAYAEMLTHLPLLEHGKAKRVMIVGGGDLSIADEALKHKGVEEVVL